MAQPGIGGALNRLRFASLPDEIRLTLLLFLFSLFIAGVPRVYTQTAAHALFIEEYGAAAMPWAYLAEALCVPLAGYLYIRAERVLSIRALLVATLASQIIVLLLFRLGIGLDIPLVAGASIVYFEIEFVLSSLLLWGLSNQLMTLRQGKRLFGFVSAGEPVAIIICGLSTPLLLYWLSPADLFLLSAFGAGIGIVIVLYILAHFRPPDDLQDDEDHDELATPQLPWWRNRYVVTMVVLVAVGQMGYFFIDNAFYLEAGKRYPDEHQLASFLGIYSAIMGAISLASSVFLAPWLLRRFGVRGGLLVLPGLLLLGSLLTVGAGVMGGAADILFILVVGNKIIDQSFRYTLDKATFVTLFQPLPAGQRIGIQAGLESVVEPLSGGVAGLLLFGMIYYLGFGGVGITAVILCISCVWIGLVAVQYKGYLGALNGALASRRVSEANLSFDDPESRVILRRGLQSHRAGEVLYCLSLLDGLDEVLTVEEINRLVCHSVREVRLELARRIEHGHLHFPAELLHAALLDETDPSVRGALIQAWVSQDEDVVPAASRWLTDPDADVRLGACIGLIRHGGIEGVLAVGPQLLDDLQSVDARRRCFAAQVMEGAGSAHFYRPLLGLLGDPDNTVARAALHAAGELAVPKLWPAMFDCLPRPLLTGVAVAALSRVGDDLLPALESRYAGAHEAPGIQRALVHILARIGTQASDLRLIALLDDPSREIRLLVLHSLWRKRKQIPAHYAGTTRRLLLSEIDHAAVLLAAWKALADPVDDSLPVLRAVLADEVDGSIENCFHLLALMVAGLDMYEAYNNYLNGGPAKRAYVIEMLDNLLDAELKRPLFALLEPEDIEIRAQRMVPAPKAVGSDLLERLEGLGAERRLPALVRAGTVYAAARLGFRPTSNAAETSAIMLETYAWAESGCLELKERETMLTIEKMMILRSVALFSAVREEYLTGVAASVREVRLAAGEQLFDEGEMGTALFVIVSGRLEVWVKGRHVAEMGELEVVGEMAALDPEPRSARVLAATDCLLLRLTKEALDILVSEDIDVARGIIQTLCRRIRQRGVAVPLPVAPPLPPITST